MKRATLILTLLICVVTLACGGPPQRDAQETSSGEETPQLTQAVVEDMINEAHVFDVMPESGKGEPIFWRFSEDEPKEIAIVEREDNGNDATLILDIKTQTASRSRLQRVLQGRIKTEWQLRTGWVLRRWEITDVENISMKYRDLPKAEASNSNTNANSGSH